MKMAEHSTGICNPSLTFEVDSSKVKWLTTPQAFIILHVNLRENSF